MLTKRKHCHTLVGLKFSSHLYPFWSYYGQSACSPSTVPQIWHPYSGVEWICESLFDGIIYCTYDAEAQDEMLNRSIDLSDSPSAGFRDWKKHFARIPTEAALRTMVLRSSRAAHSATVKPIFGLTPRRMRSLYSSQRGKYHSELSLAWPMPHLLCGGSVSQPSSGMAQSKRQVSVSNVQRFEDDWEHSRAMENV